MGSEQLPHLNLEENPAKRSKKAMFFIAVFSFLLLSLPVTVFLVQQQQRLASKAAQETQPILEKSISLTTQDQTFGVGQQIPVDVVIHSDNELANLASVKIQYNPSLIKVSEVITNPSQSANRVFFGKYWLSKGFDNTKGEISLIAGTPKPGVKTAPGGEPLLLAQIRFIAVSEGQTEISLAPDVSLLSNENNSPITVTSKNLNLSISPDASLTKTEDPSLISAKLPSKYAEMQPVSDTKNQIIISSPRSSEVFFYFRPVEIAWSAALDSIKSITLYLNGEQYGLIAENVPNTGHFTWTPSLSIPLPMLVPENTYALQITGVLKGQENKSEVSPPFGLIPNPEGKTVSASSSALLATSTLTIPDSSKMLSRWGEKLTSEDPLDLNGDQVINYLDWYLLRKGLFVKDLVY